MDRRADGLCFKTSSHSKYDVVVVYVAVVFYDVFGGCGVGGGCTNPSKRADGLGYKKWSKLLLGQANYICSDQVCVSTKDQEASAEDDSTL